MTLRPSTAPLRVPLPSPLASSLFVLADPESDSLRAASPAVTRLLATVVTDPSFKSTAASALVAELVDFAAHCRLDYAASLVAESASVCPPSVGGECALSTDVLEDRQEEFQCFAAALPHLVSMLIAPEGDPDAPNIPTPRSYAEAIEGPYSSQWQSAMDAKMASWKSTCTYVDEVPPPGANIVSGMWIFRVKRPPGSPPVFKARYVARGFSQRQGVDYFQTFSPTPKMTTLRVLLHVAAQRDYELHSLDFCAAFLQGSLHEEIWLRRPPGFIGSFPPGTQWSLRRPVYGLRQAPREWHDTLRTTLAALGFAPCTADLSLFLRTDTSLPPFYILVYVDDLVFATADTAGLAHVKSELQKRHTCTDLGELCSYLGLQITRDRAQRTITLTQSHMVQQVLQRFDFTYSSPQATPLSTRHSLSSLPSDESVEPSGPYPELVGCLMSSQSSPFLVQQLHVLLYLAAVPPQPRVFIAVQPTSSSFGFEIWLRRPPGFIGSFPPGTQWSLRRPVYGLRQAPREWHDTLRTTLAALGFAPSTADLSLFLRTDTSLPPFYILVYVDDLVFATADTAGLAHVKSELQKRHTCTDLGELRSYLGLQITRDRAQRTITLTQSHMVQQVLQRFNFTYSSPQATPLSTRHSLSSLPSDESVEPSGPYPELVGCLMYLMTCTRPDLAYPLSILARYVAPGRHRPIAWHMKSMPFTTNSTFASTSDRERQTLVSSSGAASAEPWPLPPKFSAWSRLTRDVLSATRAPSSGGARSTPRREPSKHGPCVEPALLLLPDGSVQIVCSSQAKTLSPSAHSQTGSQTRTLTAVRNMKKSTNHGTRDPSRVAPSTDMHSISDNSISGNSMSSESIPRTTNHDAGRRATRVSDVLQDHPGCQVGSLTSSHGGLLRPQHVLKPGHVYFLQPPLALPAAHDHGTPFSGRGEDENSAEIETAAARSDDSLTTLSTLSTLSAFPGPLSTFSASSSAFSTLSEFSGPLSTLSAGTAGVQDPLENRSHVSHTAATTTAAHAFAPSVAQESYSSHLMHCGWCTASRGASLESWTGKAGKFGKAGMNSSAGGVGAMEN
ncbi:unnamed protein product [Closterium sp. NIES-53]